MTSAPLVTNDFESQLPGLLSGASVVVLVPATELRGWAAETAWRVARAAARGGRRTALVDCFVDAPTLHTVHGTQNHEGITDVFEYGASLNRIVQAQPQANLFFIPAGTYAPDAQPLVANPRWKRLSAGFRHEDALLLLYVAPEHLSTLAAEPDGMVVLSPIGLDTTVAEAPAVAEALARGLPLLAVVADPDSMRVSGAHKQIEGSERVEGSERSERSERSRPSQRSSKPFAMMIEEQKAGIPWKGLAIGLAALAALIYLVVWLVIKKPAIGSRQSATADTAVSTAAPAAAPVTIPPAETLALAVSVATLPSLDQAFARLDSLEAAGERGLIAPLTLAGRPTVYRVYRGPFRAIEGANVDTVPLSLRLSGGFALPAAQAERARLRALGIPAFILGLSDGTFQLFAGAYRPGTPRSHYQDLVTPTGGAGELVPRVGYLP